MSYISYISFPSALNAYTKTVALGNENCLGINYDISHYHENLYLFPGIPPEKNAISITDVKGVVFADCFKNPYIYEYHIATPHHIKRERSKIVFSDMEYADKLQEIKMFSDKNRCFYLRTLHDFIDENLMVGSFAEIYTVWTDHTNFIIKAPLSECTIDLTEIVDATEAIGITAGHKAIIVKHGVHFRYEN